MSRVKIDIGSTYIKLCIPEKNLNEQYFREFSLPLYKDLEKKCGKLISSYSKEDISICSSANEGLKAHCIALTRSFSLQYLIQTALNAGGNIMGNSVLSELKSLPVEKIDTDVLLLAGGIDLEEKQSIYPKLISYIREKISFKYMVFCGNKYLSGAFKKAFPDMYIFENILDEKLSINNQQLLDFIKSQYFKDIVKKDDISPLYAITANDIFPTPYIVNQAYRKSVLNGNLNGIVLPFIAVDIGGATTDIHYSSEIVSNGRDQLTFNRIVFKNLGIFKSRESLFYSLKGNEYTHEFSRALNLPFPSKINSDSITELTPPTLATYALFLVLLNTSHLDKTTNLNIDYRKLRSILITGGACKLLGEKDIERVLVFLFSKLQISKQTGINIVIDKDYNFWSNGFNDFNYDQGANND